MQNNEIKFIVSFKSFMSFVNVALLPVTWEFTWHVQIGFVEMLNVKQSDAEQQNQCV